MASPHAFVSLNEHNNLKDQLQKFQAELKKEKEMTSSLRKQPLEITDWRSLSIEGPVKTVDPIEEERIKREPQDETVEKEKKPVNLGPRLVEIALIKASGIAAKEEKDIKKEEDSDSPKTKRARNEMTEPEDVIKQEQLDETIEQNVETLVYLEPIPMDIETERNETPENESSGEEQNSDSKRKEQFECTHCGKQFKTKQNLKRHLRIHTGEFPFQCLECDKKFNQKSNLTTHVKTVHRGEKPFACDICEMKFAYKDSLIKHKRKHDGLKPFECDLCNKTFSRNDNLITHRRTHTGLRPFECDLCDQTFARNDSLTGHRLIHTGIRPYSCSFCGKQFITSSNMKKHEKIHQGINEKEVNKQK